MGATGTPVEMDETFVGGKPKNMHRSKRLKQRIGMNGYAEKTAVAGGSSSTFAEKSQDVLMRLGALQQSTSYLEGIASDTRDDLKGISQKIGSISNQLIRFEAMEKRLSDIEPKVDGLRLDVHAAKRIIAVAGTIISVVGAIAIVFLNKILDAIVRHYTPR